MIGIINCDLDESFETNGGHIISRIIKNSEVIDFVSGSQLSFDYDGFVITGSRASYNEDFEWIKRLREVVLEIDRLKIPCFAVCFGMQFVADVFGGKVSLNAVDEDGFVSLDLGESPIFSGLPEELFVYESHHDIVASPPEGAVLIAENSNCIQGFHLRNFYCVQFHPEISAEVATIMAQRDNLDVDSKLNGVEKDYSFPERMLLNFADICKSN